MEAVPAEDWRAFSLEADPASATYAAVIRALKTVTD